MGDVHYRICDRCGVEWKGEHGRWTKSFGLFRKTITEVTTHWAEANNTSSLDETRYLLCPPCYALVVEFLEPTLAEDSTGSDAALRSEKEG